MSEENKALGIGENEENVEDQETTISKSQYDKLASDYAALKKQMRSRNTDDENRKIEMEEKDNLIKELQNKVTVSKIKGDLSETGLDIDSITAISEAFASSDVDSFTKALIKATRAINNKHSKEIDDLKLELTPRPSDGTNGEDKKPVTQEEFNEMAYTEQLEFKEKNPELYKKYVKAR